MELFMLLGLLLLMVVTVVTYVGAWLIVFGMVLVAFEVLPWWVLLGGFIVWFTTEYRAAVREEESPHRHD